MYKEFLSKALGFTKINSKMKKYILYLLLFIFCSCQSRGLLLNQKELDNITISNKIGKHVLLKDYISFLNNSDTIYFENIFFYEREKQTTYFLGNIMGGKTSLLVGINNKNKVKYIEESAVVDSAKVLDISKKVFLLVDRHYEDMCSKQCYFSIYSIKGSNISKIYDDYRYFLNYNIEEYCASTEMSFEQSFELDINNDSLFLNVHKIWEDGKDSYNKIYLSKL